MIEIGPNLLTLLVVVAGLAAVILLVWVGRR